MSEKQDNRSATADGLLDAMTAAPDHHHVLLENEHVRVLDTRLAAGEATPVHEHGWPAVLHVLSWSDFVRIDPSGNVMLDSCAVGMNPKAGEILWGPALKPHAVRNVGTGELRVIAIELKHASKA
jgi:quercetin dioxygenase-like cupin family protein